MHLVARSTRPVKCRNDFHHGGCYNRPQPPDCGMELSRDLRIGGTLSAARALGLRIPKQ